MLLGFVAWRFEYAVTETGSIEDLKIWNSYYDGREGWLTISYFEIQTMNEGWRHRRLAFAFVAQQSRLEFISAASQRAWNCYRTACTGTDASSSGGLWCGSWAPTRTKRAGRSADMSRSSDLCASLCGPWKLYPLHNLPHIWRERTGFGLGGLSEWKSGFQSWDHFFPSVWFETASLACLNLWDCIKTVYFFHEKLIHLIAINFHAGNFILINLVPWFIVQLGT